MGFRLPDNDLPGTPKAALLVNIQDVLRTEFWHEDYGMPVIGPRLLYPVGNEWHTQPLGVYPRVEIVPQPSPQLRAFPTLTGFSFWGFNFSLDDNRVDNFIGPTTGFEGGYANWLNVSDLFEHPPYPEERDLIGRLAEIFATFFEPIPHPGGFRSRYARRKDGTRIYIRRNT